MDTNNLKFVSIPDAMEEIKTTYYGSDLVDFFLDLLVG